MVVATNSGSAVLALIAFAVAVVWLLRATRARRSGEVEGRNAVLVYLPVLGFLACALYALWLAAS